MRERHRLTDEVKIERHAELVQLHVDLLLVFGNFTPKVHPVDRRQFFSSLQFAFGKVRLRAFGADFHGFAVRGGRRCCGRHVVPLVSCLCHDRIVATSCMVSSNIVLFPTTKPESATLRPCLPCSN